MGLLDEIGAIETLQLFHAPEDAGFDIHHPVGVGEIARQLGEGAVHLSRSLAEIALRERDVLRSARRRPERLAAVGVQQSGIAPGIFLEHLPVLLDRLFRFAVLGDRRVGRSQAMRPQRPHTRSRGAFVGASLDRPSCFLSPFLVAVAPCCQVVAKSQRNNTCIFLNEKRPLGRAVRVGQNRFAEPLAI